MPSSSRSFPLIFQYLTLIPFFPPLLHLLEVHDAVMTIFPDLQIHSPTLTFGLPPPPARVSDKLGLPTSSSRSSLFGPTNLSRIWCYFLEKPRHPDLLLCSASIFLFRTRDPPLPFVGSFCCVQARATVYHTDRRSDSLKNSLFLFQPSWGSL